MWPQLIAAFASGGKGAHEGSRINLTTQGVVDSDDDGVPWEASAGFVIRSDGKLDHVTFLVPPTDPTDEWVDGYPDAAYAADYECQVTEESTAGAATRNGTVGTSWIDCSTANSNRDWSIDMGSVTASWGLRVKIRHKTSLVEYANAVISLSVLDAFS